VTGLIERKEVRWKPVKYTSSGDLIRKTIWKAYLLIMDTPYKGVLERNHRSRTQYVWE
jgi:hypothetical protein